MFTTVLNQRWSSPTTEGAVNPWSPIYKHAYNYVELHVYNTERNTLGREEGYLLKLPFDMIYFIYDSCPSANTAKT
jgi:hypothetical protein